MMNKAGLLKFLRIGQKEGKGVFFTLLFAFFIGAVQNILFSVPLAMFLSRFDSSYLPHIYIATGVSTFFVGMAFIYLERAVSFFYVLALPTALFSASLLLFWGVLFIVKSPWIFVVFLIWSLLVSSLITSVVMLLVNQLFTSQQSKRLYGLIFASLSLGGIVIGLGMDLLIKTIGSNHLILIAGLILFGGFLMQFMIRKHSSSRFPFIPEKEKSKAPKISLNSFRDKKYILYVFLLASFICFICYAFDLLLNTSVKRHFPNEAEMAVFYGILFAVYNIAAVVSGFFLSGWVLSRFGLIISLLILPIGLILLLSSAFAAHLISSLEGIVFGLILIVAVFEATMRESIVDQSILLLFQPLRPAQRAWSQIKNETIINPLAMTVIGSILLVIDKIFNLRLPVIALIIILLSLCVLAIVIFKIKGGYVRLLEESLSKRSLSLKRFIKLGKDRLSVLKGHLKSKRPEEVLYVLQMIEGIDKDEFVKIVPELLDSPFEQVRRFSLEKIDQYRIKAAEERLKQLCSTEKNPAILGPGLLAFGAISDLKLLPWLRNLFDDSNVELAYSSIIALIKYGSDTEKNEAIEVLKKKAESSEVDQRLMVARALKEIDIPIKTELLLNLLKDSAQEVRVVACDAIAGAAEERLYPALIANLEIPHVNDAAITSLSTLGRPLLNFIFNQYETYSDDLKVEVVNFLGFIKEQEAIVFLEKQLLNSKRMILYEVLWALKRHNYRSINDEKYQGIFSLLMAENQNILDLQELVIALNRDKTQLLQSLISREIELSQECCFLLLSFIYPGTSIMEAYYGLAVEDEDFKSNAEELLLNTLKPKDQNFLKDQLLYNPRKEEAKEHFNDKEAEELLLKVKDYGANCFIPALSAAVVYEIGVLRLTSLAGLLAKQDTSKDPLMKESIEISLKKLKAEPT